MKKLILSAVLILAGASIVLAQDATAVMQRYLKASNLESIESHTSLMIDMTTSVMGTAIPAIVIQESAGNKMRIDMNTAGQQILVVINGEKGWVQAGGQVNPLPKSQLAQMSGQGDFLKNIKWDTGKYNFIYLGEKDGIETVQIIPLTDDKKLEESMAYFDKKTGLLQSLIVKTGDVEVKVAMSDYKKFGTVTIPTKLVTQMGGNTVSTVTINKFETNYPTAAYMFIEPK